MKPLRFFLIALTPLLFAAPALAAAEEESGGNLFAGSVYQALAAIITFIALLWILHRFAWGPILNGLQQREAKIKEDLQQAERANEEARQTLEQYKEQLAEANAEARKVIDQAKADAQSVRQRMIAEAEEEMQRHRQRATREIERAKEAALEELHEQVGDLAVAVASKILQRQISEDDTRNLVDQSLREMDNVTIG